MGDIQEPAPTLYLLAAFSRHSAALDWARQRAEDRWGSIVAASERFEFAETKYYEPTMGPGLQKQFLAFKNLISPERLSSIKCETNAWEEEYAQQAPGAEPRPLNLDPGYLTLAKLVLASTKDHAHRIYLAHGIFAEVTLSFREGRWQALPWTFPDYRRDDYQAFFSQCRQWLKEQRNLRSHSD